MSVMDELSPADKGKRDIPLQSTIVQPTGALALAAEYDMEVSSYHVFIYPTCHQD